MSYEVVAPNHVDEVLKKEGRVKLIDVRTSLEFREVHAAAARNIPLSDLTAADVAPANKRHEAVYLICQSGTRARQACEQLAAQGFTRLYNVEGGTVEWVKRGLPVVRGKKGMSLERQVRIAAGSLVLIGVALSYFVHPYLIGLSAFVGAGLVFAGITDTCGMGMILAKMPWNQVRDAAPSADSAPSCPV
jgi:rhodanese-related sulfurtransferase